MQIQTQMSQVKKIDTPSILKGKLSNPKYKTRKLNKRRKASNKNLPKGVVHIQTTFNNTIVTITNLRGTVIAWSSAGNCGFKGARKSTPFAAKTTAETAARQSASQGLTRVKVMIKGVGSGRKTAMRGLLQGGLHIADIRDITGIPHNGCRPPKKRRV
jgi:small subunit ribosomal protein S11